MDAKTLYQQVILDHGNHPRNEGPWPEAGRHATGTNPLCGDRVTIHLSEEGGKLAVRFEARGCLIAKASASLLTEAVKGKTRGEAEEIAGAVEAIVEGRSGAEERGTGLGGEVGALRGAAAFPARRGCVLLAWRTLREVIGQDR